jgi:hypothetical protein
MSRFCHSCKKVVIRFMNFQIHIRRTEMWFNNLILFMLGCAPSSRRLDAAHDDGIADSRP